MPIPDLLLRRDTELPDDVIAEFIGDLQPRFNAMTYNLLTCVPGTGLTPPPASQAPHTVSYWMCQADWIG